jgi:hypothetical protein
MNRRVILAVGFLVLFIGRGARFAIRSRSSASVAPRSDWRSAPISWSPPPACSLVAFASHRGVEALLAGHPLALMGLVGFVGVIAGGAWSDKAGPVTPDVACFLVRTVASP